MVCTAACSDWVCTSVTFFIDFLACLCVVMGRDSGKRHIRMALCQIVCLAGDRAGNFKRIEHACEEAAGNGADVACFPETSILGWVNPDAWTRGFPIPGNDSDRLCELACRYGLFIAIGLVERDAACLYDSAVLVDYTGSLVLKHRKINILSGLMTPPYTPGNTIDAVDTAFGRFGLMICADTFDGALLDRSAQCGPDILCVPYGWAATPYMWPCHGEKLASVVSRAAKKTGAVVVGVDSVGQIAHGPWKGKIFGGQSVVAGRDGSIIATAKDRDRDILIVDIPC